MISNFRSQLEMQKALDKLPEVLKEVAQVREDLGFPPLVTPTSQIVGTQAVMNIIAGERYKIIPNEVKDYVKGMYGRSPAPISDEFIKKILGDEKPITHRPADKFSPMLPKATDGIDAKFIVEEEDIISYVMLPEPALEFFKYRAAPADQRPETPADIELKKILGATAPAPKAAEPAPAPAPEPVSAPESSVFPDKFQNIAGELMGKIDGLSLEELLFRKGDFTIAVRTAGTPSSVGAPSVARAVSETVAAPKVAASAPKAESAPAAPAKVEKVAYSQTINAPLTGTFYSSPGQGKERFVKEGDIVNAGDKVCIVEAMKLFNPINAAIKCKIVAFIAKDGQGVEKGQPLVGIEPV
jgi:oxaloacetate decarboxylase alpha subunit